MREENLATKYDVIVVGSGSCGMLSAIRAHDLGLSVIVVEKSHFFGGSSAMSGGNIWAPNNHLMQGPDSAGTAFEYLAAATEGQIPHDMLAAFVDHAPRMIRYLEEVGVPLRTISHAPDYMFGFEGAKTGRAVVPIAMDAALLGDQFHRLRPPHPMWQLFGRYAMDQDDLGMLAFRLPGWRRRVARMLWRYWRDLPWRRQTRRDRKLTLGNALVGGLRRAMIERGIPLAHNMALLRLRRNDLGVHAAIFSRNGDEIEIEANRAVILAAGGFEHSQALRSRYMPMAVSPETSQTPLTNAGDALLAAQEVGAATDFMPHGYWFPGMQLPAAGAPQRHDYHMLFRYPHSLCVNRAGERFTNEAASFDAFGEAMVEDHRKTGRNLPSWMIFDAQFREKYACGGLMPNVLMPDRKVPKPWWDAYVYRADTITELAVKIGLDGAKLDATVRRFNSFAQTGVDDDFGRGSTVFDRAMGGDPRMHPNPSLGTLSKGPYYAVRVYLCDLGTKGGVKINSQAAVLNTSGTPIAGLYSVGVNAAAIFGSAFPGPGASLGPANTFALLAAEAIAAQQRSTVETRRDEGPFAGADGASAFTRQ